MKIKEFKEEIDNIGLFSGEDLEVTDHISYFYIESGSKILATVGKSMIGIIDTNFPDFSKVEERLRQALFDTIYEFASTPIEERGDEKKYYLKHRFLNGSVNQFLNRNLIDSRLDLSTKKDYSEFQTKFTQKEIDKIKEKYNTDLKDFEIIEVEE